MLREIVLRSGSVIQAGSPSTRDEVQFEFIDYRNDARYYYPDNFRNYYNQVAGVESIVGKQPNPSSPFSSELISDLWITMPITLSAQEAKHLNEKTKIETFTTKLREFYADENTIYRENDIWYTDFILTWNVIQHFFPYKKSSEEMFDFSSLEQLFIGLEQISDATEKKSASYKAVKDYVSLFQDGHARVRRFRTPEVENQNSSAPRNVRSFLPFYRMYSQGKVYVIRSFDPKIRNGDEVLEINNTPVTELINREVSNGVSSPQFDLLSAVGIIGNLFNTSTGVVKLKRDDKILTEEVNTISGGEYGEYFYNPFGHKPFEYPEPNTIYINLALASPEAVREKMTEILGAEHLIFDLRAYPNAFSSRQIFEHLPVDNGFGRSLILNTPLIMYPNQELKHNIWSSSLTAPQKPFINADISVLIGSSIPSGTRSRGETFASYFKYAGAALIGDSNSMGAAGGVDYFTTPGKMRVELTTSYTVRQNGEKMQSVGIAPDILVKQTPKGLKKGKDLVYEAALKRMQQE